MSALFDGDVLAFLIPAVDLPRAADPVVGIGDHLSIGSDVIIGARSGVVANAADGSVLLGTPAVAREEALAIALATRRLPRLVETVRALKKRLSAVDPKG